MCVDNIVFICLLKCLMVMHKWGKGCRPVNIHFYETAIEYIIKFVWRLRVLCRKKRYLVP